MRLKLNMVITIRLLFGGIKTKGYALDVWDYAVTVRLSVRHVVCFGTIPYVSYHDVQTLKVVNGKLNSEKYSKLLTNFQEDNVLANAMYRCGLISGSKKIISIHFQTWT